jgi:hypothetical protein
MLIMPGKLEMNSRKPIVVVFLNNIFEQDSIGFKYAKRIFTNAGHYFVC